MCFQNKYLGYVLFALLLFTTTANSEILGTVGMCYNEDLPNRCVFGWRVRYIGNQRLELKSLSDNDIIVETSAGTATNSKPNFTLEGGNYEVGITYSTGKFKVAPDSQENWSIKWAGGQFWNLKYFKMSDSLLMNMNFKEQLLSCVTSPYNNREDIKFNLENCDSYYYDALYDEMENRPSYQVNIYDKKDTCRALEAKKRCDSEGKSGSQSCVTEKTRLLKKQCDNDTSDGKEKSLCSCTLL